MRCLRDGNSKRFRIVPDGRYIAFESSATNLVARDTNEATDVFVHDRKTGATERMSVDSAGIEGDSDSGAPSLSADGRYVVFDSRATNLVPNDTGQSDVFIHDRATGKTARVSVGCALSSTNAVKPSSMRRRMTRVKNTG